MTTWRDIQVTENTEETFWSQFSSAELREMRKGLMQDSRDTRRWGSYADGASYDRDIAEIEAVLYS